MADPVKQHVIKIDLAEMNVHRSYMQRIIGEGDIGGDVFIAEVYKNGQKFDLGGGQVIGFFVRADGTTQVITGYKKDQNKACVVLPEACYAVLGNFTLAVKVTATNFAGTLMIVDGTVLDVTTGNINDPSGTFPDTEDYAAYVAAAQTAAETIDGISITSEQITGTRYKIKVTKT